MEKTKFLAKPEISFVFAAGLSLGGVTSFNLEMVKRLSEKGLKINMITHSEENILAPDYLSGKVINLPKILDGNYTESMEINTSLKGYQDALSSVFIPNMFYLPYAVCARVAREKAIRIIGIAHSDDPHYYNLLKYYEPIISVFVAVSPKIYENLSKIIPLRKKDIFMRPYAVNAAEKLNRKFNHSNPLKITYAGRFEEGQKRVSDIIKLASLLDKKGVDFIMRLVGDGCEKENLLRDIKSLNPKIRDKVVIEAARTYSEMSNVWLSSDICLLVSSFEGTSISMLEAMACGCVPVVTEVSGTNILIQNKNGCKIAFGNLDKMAEAIKFLDTHRSKLEYMGKNAHKTILVSCNYKDYIPWFEDLCLKAAQQTARRWPLLKPVTPIRLKLKKIYAYSHYLKNKSKTYRLFLMSFKKLIRL